MGNVPLSTGFYHVLPVSTDRRISEPSTLVCYGKLSDSPCCDLSDGRGTYQCLATRILMLGELPGYDGKPMNLHFACDWATSFHRM